MSNKLSGIYSALDSGNNKQALKLCNAILTKKKDENTNIVKVLKAITLGKLGETEEAIKCADEVTLTGHYNETLLSNLNYFYKSVQQGYKMTHVYEVSTKAYPNNENLAEGLFLAYAKVRDYKKQQQTILDLQKNFPSHQHSLWYLMTILSMVHENPSNQLFVGLSQKLAEKLVEEGKIKTSEHLHMYETVLDIQGKTSEHLNIIKGKLGELYGVPTERLKILGILNQKLGNHQEAANNYSEILSKYEPDEWSCYMGYFDNIWALNDISKIDDAKQFIQNIQSQQNSKHLLRGPLLAEIEIYYRLLTTNNPASLDGPVSNKFIELILKYFTKFGTKPVLYSDLKKYLQFIETKKSVEQRKEIMDRIHKLVSLDRDNPNRISQLSNYHKLYRVLGLQLEMTLEESIKTIKDIIEEYQYNTKKFPLPIESERYPGDDLILICHFLLMDQYEKTKQVSLLLESSAILELAHSISTKNYQFNLNLLSLYFELGAHQMANDHFKILNIKNIQWDTLGHLVMDQYVREPTCFTNTINFFEKSAKFYNENESTADYVAACYQNGCYSKILEIQKFQVKVANSFQKSVYETERQLFNFMLIRHKNLPSANFTAAQLVQICKSQISSTDPINFDCSNEVLNAFSFNQDKTIFDQFNPTNGIKEIEKEIQGVTSLYLENSEESTLLLQLTYRRQILNILYLISTQSPIDLNQLNQLLIAFESTINHLNSIKSNSIDNLTRISTLNNFKLLNSILSLLKEFNEEKLKLVKELFELVNKEISGIVKVLSDNIRESVILGNSLNSASRSSRMVVSSFIEPITWFSFIALLVNSALPGKRAKKKEEYHTIIRSDLESLVKQLSDDSSNLSNIITEKSFSKLSLNEDDNKNNESTILETLNTKSVAKNVSENSIKSVTELQQYLNSMKTLLTFSINNTNNPTA
ncbi:hypothetical protein RB653_003589 [Dictyostelium firmibasis]|uniref:N-alpha-acetyltransferase 25, NatB auxiliary subunit n=1 Tax=Dictyostelium firmibasis TaxID=79012 RepID=A0AAN7U4U3_9MYCE